MKITEDILEAFVDVISNKYMDMIEGVSGEVSSKGVRFEYRTLDFVSFMNEYGVDIDEVYGNDLIEVVSEYAGDDYPLYSVMVFDVDGEDVPIVFLLRPVE